MRAGGSRSVDVTATVTPMAEQRAMIALFRGTTRVETGRAPATYSVGTLLTFTMSADLSLKAHEVKLTPPSATSNALIDVALENDGDEPFMARGVAAILDGKGAMVGKTTFAQRRLLPGEKTSLQGEYAGELAAGKYRVLSTFEYEGRSLTRTAELTVP